MEKVNMVIINGEVHNNVRKICEDIQCRKFDSRKDAIEAIAELLGVRTRLGEIKGVEVVDLDTFMDGVNDQEIDDLTCSMITYISIENK